MEKDLVQKAKDIKPTRTNFQITPQVVKLALAWSKDEVTITQCEKVLGVKEHNKIYAILARALKASAKSPEEKVKESDKEIQKKPTSRKLDPPNLNMVEEDNTIKVSRKASDEAPSKY